MMTLEMMVEMLEALGNDVTFDVDGTNIDVTVEDFGGFDEDWSEIDREFDDEEAVDAFLETLTRECVSQEGDFYVVYHFEGFDLELGYGSFDI